VYGIKGIAKVLIQRDINFSSLYAVCIFCTNSNHRIFKNWHLWL